MNMGMVRSFQPQGTVKVKQIDETVGVIKRPIELLVETNGEIAKASCFYIPKDFVLMHHDDISEYLDEITEELESLVEVIVSQSNCILNKDALLLKQRLLKFIEPFIPNEY
jgi:hypothetical protein